MKKLEEMFREKPIKNKLSFVFRIMDVLYVCWPWWQLWD